MACQRIAGGEHRVGRAPLLGLHENLGVGSGRLCFGRHGLHPGADNHGEAIGFLAPREGQHMTEHRQTGDLVQHLGQCRLHARALAGGAATVVDAVEMEVDADAVGKSILGIVRRRQRHPPDRGEDAMRFLTVVLPRRREWI